MYACDVDESRLEHISKLYPAVKLSKDYREILESKEVDAVCIATPTAAHFQIAKDALLHGKHVLVEKPMTLNSRQAQELIQTAADRNKILMVGHTFEYNAAVNRLKDLVQSGELGNILYVSMTRVNLGIFRDDVNVVWDLCPHDISILTYILKETPISITAQGGVHYKEGVEDVAFAILRYPDNLLAHIHVSWLDPRKARTVVVVGDKKMAIYDDLNDTEPIRIFDKHILKQPYYETFGEFKLLYHWGDVYSPKIDTVEPLRVECSHFIDCIEGKTIPRSDGASGLKVVQILEAVQESLQNGGRTVELTSK